MLRALAFASVLALSPSAALAQEEAAVTTTGLGHGIYELSTGRAGNVGVLIGEDGQPLTVDGSKVVAGPLAAHACRTVDVVPRALTLREAGRRAWPACGGASRP